VLTVKRACVPVELGCAADRRGAESITSGVNLVAVRVMLCDMSDLTESREL
jgi:hypothetical protein